MCISLCIQLKLKLILCIQLLLHIINFNFVVLNFFLNNFYCMLGEFKKKILVQSLTTHFTSLLFSVLPSCGVENRLLKLALLLLAFSDFNFNLRSALVSLII